MAVYLQAERQALRFQKFKYLKKNRQKRSGQVWINVTALVDMMTVLVIFLVMQFSSTGQMLFITKDIKVPDAKHGIAVDEAPILSINNAADLFYEGELITTNLSTPKSAAGLEIPSLFAKLNKLQNSKTINVQIDQGINFGIIKRILFTCEKAGFDKIRLAVSRKTTNTF
ncbi:MAG: biopolymer transporter ExbD [bacterium]|nr:biopolymer transporter ExbD [bacterium]